LLRNYATEESMARDADLTVYEMQAEIAKALANPIRLRVLHLIGARELSYATLLAELGISKTNLSQHLAVLRKSGVLRVRRDGVHVHYRLTYPEIQGLCQTMREILVKHLGAAGRHARTLMRQAG
jgi:ArsR family transcriptional regulator